MTESKDRKRASEKNANRNINRQPVSFQERELRKMLVKDEEIILRAKLHGAIYWKSVAVLIIGALVGLFLIPAIGILLCVSGAIMLCVTILTQHYLLLAITNKRVLARYGLLQMDVVDIRLSKIESIDLERMLPGHIFGYANVVVMGTGNRMMRIPYISNAESFRRFYNEMVLAEEGSEEGEEEVRNLKELAETYQNTTPHKKNKV